MHPRCTVIHVDGAYKDNFHQRLLRWQQVFPLLDAVGRNLLRTNHVNEYKSEAIKLTLFIQKIIIDDHFKNRFG